jgi:hypothetical protein
MRTQLVVVVLSILVSGCPATLNHQNFMDIMQAQVGRRIDDRDSFRNRYSQRRVGVKLLPNGNEEEEYMFGYKHRCHVFFELDHKAAKVVAWRYEGSKSDCSIAL